MPTAQLLVRAVVPNNNALEEVRSRKVAIDNSSDAGAQVKSVLQALQIATHGDCTMVYDSREGLLARKDRKSGKIRFTLAGSEDDSDVEVDGGAENCSDDDDNVDILTTMENTLTAVELSAVFKEGQKLARTV